VKTDEIILKTLSKNPGGHVSGQELARAIGISRAAVWKRIKKLRDFGFHIKADTARGYTLEGIEDLIKPDLISKKLETRFVGKNIIYKHFTASTNDEAFALAREDAPEGTCVIADVQTRGRGRLGRSWLAPAASAVLTSIVFRPKLSPQTATLLTLAAGVAAARAVGHVTDLEPWIKWPNDLYIMNRKLAGILTEMRAELDRVHFVIVGVGINVNIERKTFPREIRKLATSLSIETGREINRNQLIATLYREMERAYNRLVERGPKVIIKQWEDIAKVRGRHVKASLIGGRKAVGIAQGLDSDGALLIEDKCGKIRRITAGDVEVTGWHGLIRTDCQCLQWNKTATGNPAPAGFARATLSLLPEYGRTTIEF